MAIVKFPAAPVRNVFDFWHPHFQVATATQPAVNVVETPQGFRIELAAPGLSKEDFQVKIENDLLSISASKKTETTENGAQYRRREFGFAEFQRAFRLPDTVDAHSVKAAFNNGILQVELSKKPEAQPVVKTVEIA